MMIDVKKAVRNAMGFVKDLYESDTPADLMLEEVRISDDEKYWLITVGFSRKSWMAPLGGDERSRAYKVIKIDAETGKPIEMAIRLTVGELATA